MRSIVHTRHVVYSVIAVLVVALIALLTGCGNAASPQQTPSTIYPQASATGTLPALKAYLSDAQDILGQVSATVSTLPAAVKDMSVKPDSTWQSSAAQLDSIAGQLGDEAAALEALQPPTALQPVQDAAVKGIRTAQSGVQKLSDKLKSGQQNAATKKAEVQAKVDQLKAQVDGLAQQLKGAISGLGL